MFLAILSTTGTAATEDAFAGVEGVTSGIIAAGVRAYKVANADAYRTVYLSTIAFSAVAIALTFFAPNTEEYMTGDVAATLDHDEASLDKEIGEKA